MEAEEKYAALVSALRAMKGVLVAFSGGVDSSLLLAAAKEAQGDRALAVIGRSASYPAREHEEALAVARHIGARHLTIETLEISNPEYLRNPTNRCFICKSTLFGSLMELAAKEGLGCVVEGSNADDQQDFRPGMQAARKLGVRAPLMEVGLTKTEIRALARARDLAVWDKPSLACLSSRIPYGSAITPQRLARIDRAEEAIRARGFRQVRVRDHGELARVEVDPESVSRLLDADLRREVVAALKQEGYRYVALDLEGYRTGSMNEGLTPAARTR
jgi:uncharacterized protein